MTKRSDFEWDFDKDELNQKKHGVPLACLPGSSSCHFRGPGTQRSGKPVLLSWESRWRNYDRKIHLSKKQNQNYWRRILAERKKDI